MGREIELKIPLTDAEYEKIFCVICGKAQLSGVEVCSENGRAFAFEHILKSDSYFSRYNSRAESKAAGEPQVIRIRSEQLFDDNDEKSGLADSKSYFCIKRKTIENGIELNREDETFVEKPEVIRDLLIFSGYHQFFEKKKEAFSVFCKSEVLENCVFHLELEKVNGLKYIEVEVTDDFDFAESGILDNSFSESCSAKKCLSACDIRLALEKFVALFGLDSSKKDSRSWMEILKGGAL